MEDESNGSANFTENNFLKKPEDFSGVRSIVKGKNQFSGFACIPVVLILIFIAIIILLPSNQLLNLKSFECDPNCKIEIVESIPDGLNYSKNSPRFMTTFDAWIKLIDQANETLDIASFYWTLRGEDVINHTSAAKGEKIFNKILTKGIETKVKIQIAQSAPTVSQPNNDTEVIAKQHAAEVFSVDFPRLLGGGVLHTKLWIADKKHFYLGSANMDWRSLTQVKELGVLMTDCSCLTTDVQKIFNAYLHLSGADSNIPNQWPDEYSTEYNNKHPLEVAINGLTKVSTFFSSSPPPLTAKGREQDLDAIVSIILSAKSFVNIAVMDYLPLIIYTSKQQYWPYIDDALRKAAIDNGVSIKMLISWWPHSMHSEDNFLRSLLSLSSVSDEIDIQIKRFIVPADDDQSKIPFSRVNHNKYMVTDTTAYIGTSNWVGDYFTDTAGIGLALRDYNTISDVRSQLLSVFVRDWESPYAIEFK